MTRSRLTTADLRDLLAQRIVVFDGAMGTQLQNRNLTAADFGGEEYAGCNENLVLTRPDVVAFFRTEGFHVVDVEQAGLLGATDSAILASALLAGC